FRHRFARGGKCFLELRDITWRGGSSYRYRLRIGRFPIVGVPFPLAITAGAESEVEITSLAATGPIVARLPISADRDASIVRVPGADPTGGSAFAFVDTSSLPSILDREPNDDVSTAQEVAIPGAIDGRFERERDRDYFVLRGEPRARVELRGITGER